MKNLFLIILYLLPSLCFSDISAKPNPPEDFTQYETLVQDMNLDLTVAKSQFKGCMLESNFMYDKISSCVKKIFVRAFVNFCQKKSHYKNPEELKKLEAKQLDGLYFDNFVFDLSKVKPSSKVLPRSSLDLPKGYLGFELPLDEKGEFSSKVHLRSQGLGLEGIEVKICNEQIRKGEISFLKPLRWVL